MIVTMIVGQCNLIDARLSNDTALIDPAGDQDLVELLVSRVAWCHARIALFIGAD